MINVEGIDTLIGKSYSSIGEEVIINLIKDFKQQKEHS